jgi:hypothetical protein
LRTMLSDDVHAPRKSKVLHVSHPDSTMTLLDIVHSVVSIVAPSFAYHIPGKQQALLEFRSENDASAVLAFAGTKSLSHHSHQLSFSYSRAQEIYRHHAFAVSLDPQSGLVTLVPPEMSADVHPSGVGESKSKTMLLSCIDPRVEVGVRELLPHLSPFGEVQRIITFYRNGLQCLVEFATAAEAMDAVEVLNGTDLAAPDLLTVRAELSSKHAGGITVKRQCEQAWDFTLAPFLPPHSSSEQQQSSHPVHHHLNHLNAPPLAAVEGSRSSGSATSLQQVLHVRGLPSWVTIRHLCNIVSLYGHILRAKLLHSRGQSVALIQMGSSTQALCVLHNLQQLPLGAQHKLQWTIANSPYVITPANAAESDGYLDAAMFGVPSSTPLGSVNKPSKSLFVSGIPISHQMEDLKSSNMDEGGKKKMMTATIMKLLHEAGAEIGPPSHVHGETHKNMLRGWLTMQSIGQAATLVMRLNNYRVEGTQIIRWRFTNDKKAQPECPTSAE